MSRYTYLCTQYTVLRSTFLHHLYFLYLFNSLFFSFSHRLSVLLIPFLSIITTFIWPSLFLLNSFFLLFNPFPTYPPAKAKIFHRRMKQSGSFFILSILVIAEQRKQTNWSKRETASGAKNIRGRILTLMGLTGIKITWNFTWMLIAHYYHHHHFV